MLRKTVGPRLGDEDEAKLVSTILGLTLMVAVSYADGTSLFDALL